MGGESPSSSNTKDPLAETRTICSAVRPRKEGERDGQPLPTLADHPFVVVVIGNVVKSGKAREALDP